MNPLEYRLMYRLSFKSFVRFAFRELNPKLSFHPNWHIPQMSDLLQASFFHPEIPKRLIFNLPPDSFKTHVCAVSFPAWLLGRDPRKSVLILSESIDLAEETKERCAELMDRPRYKAVFHRTRIKSNGRALTLTYGGGIRYGGIGNSWGHKKSDIVIIDNPQSMHTQGNLEMARFREIGRLLKNRIEGIIIVATRRIGEGDLSGHLLRQSQKWLQIAIPTVGLSDESWNLSSDEYTRLTGELLHPDYHGWKYVESEIQELGGEAFAYQHMQGLYRPQTQGHRPGINEYGEPVTYVGTFDPTQVTLEDCLRWRENHSQRVRLDYPEKLPYL
ncbi:hypothetical protein OVA24_05850 [Luteolibacter sp. SL250]|uniref:hypothetical protein n=1 Tax=Luteolibacter sp. SL250 TaxID=2995170 RepID=UPI00227042F2|nr:hypothetical protein [Luteolibacter sp. SL250]WAC20904.1 hypothetical protein OVA24_05850 [Luteolibacter sp. SL250]